MARAIPVGHKGDPGVIGRLCGSGIIGSARDPAVDAGAIRCHHVDLRMPISIRHEQDLPARRKWSGRGQGSEPDTLAVATAAGGHQAAGQEP